MRRGGYIVGEGADTCVFKPQVDCEPGTESNPIPDGNYVSRVIPKMEGEQWIQERIRDIVDDGTEYLKTVPEAKEYLGDRPLSEYFNFAVGYCTPKFKPKDFTDADNFDRDCKYVAPDSKAENLVNLITPEQGSNLHGTKITKDVLVELERLLHAIIYLNTLGVVHTDLHFNNVAWMGNHLVVHDWGRAVSSEREFASHIRSYLGTEERRKPFVDKKFHHFMVPARLIESDPTFMTIDSKRKIFMQVYDILSVASQIAGFTDQQDLVNQKLIIPLAGIISKRPMYSNQYIAAQSHVLVGNLFDAIEEKMFPEPAVGPLPVPTATPTPGGGRKVTKKVLSQKFCKCVKSVRRKMGEKAAIGVCVKSVLHTRGLTLKRFTCGKRGGRLTTQRMYPADPQDAADDTAERIRKTTNDIRSTLKSSECVQVDMRGAPPPTPQPVVSPMPVGTPVAPPSYVYSLVPSPAPVQSRPTPQLVYPTSGRSPASGTPVYISAPAGSISGTRPYSSLPLSPSPQYLSMPPSRSLQMMTQPQTDCRSPSTMPR